MKNPIKALAITNTILLVGLIIFVAVAVRPQTESGEKINLIPKKNQEGSDEE